MARSRKKKSVKNPVPSQITELETAIAEVRGSRKPSPRTARLISSDYRACPLSDLRADRFERLSRVEIRHSFRRPEAAIRATAGEPSGYGPFPTHGQA